MVGVCGAKLQLEGAEAAGDSARLEAAVACCICRPIKMVIIQSSVNLESNAQS
jgi:hypothetical protein